MPSPSALTSNLQNARPRLPPRSINDADPQLLGLEASQQMAAACTLQLIQPRG